MMIFVLWGIFGYSGEEVFFESVGRGEVSFYTRYAAGEIEKAEVIQNGAGSIVQCAFEDYREVRSALGEISGVSISFEGDSADIEALCKKLEVVSVASENLEECGIMSYYGFTTKLNSRVLADGKYINIQIAQKDSVITVGYPLILGSY